MDKRNPGTWNIAEDCPTIFEIQDEQWTKGWNHTIRAFHPMGDSLRHEEFAAYVTDFLDYLYHDPYEPLNYYQIGVCDAIDALMLVIEAANGCRIIPSYLEGN